MRRAIILAAAMTIAACHSRSEDEAGAAPDPGNPDEATTHVIDSTRTGPPGVGGRPPGGTVTLDSVVTDSANVVADTTQMSAPSPGSAPQDTLGPGNLDTTNMAAPSADTSDWSGAGAVDTSWVDTTGGNP
jgi:hypothetical protein